MTMELSLTTQALAGATFAALAIIRSIVYRYRHTARKLEETRVDRFKRVMSKVSPYRVVVTLLIGAGVFIVLWTGIGDLASGVL